MAKFAKELILSLTQAAAHARGRKVRGLRVSKFKPQSTTRVESDDFELVRGSGNVFRDFGDPDAEILQHGSAPWLEQAARRRRNPDL
jgi:hypothetical protein